MIKKFLPALLVTFAFTVIVSGQANLRGKVVEVIDARTLRIETGSGRMTAQLQYVEVPEPDQPLHSVVKDHLSKLAVGKTIEFKALSIFRGNTIGKMTADGVDLSLQMIRDGAAWHVPVEMSGQNRADFDLYAGSEALARQEKRGVWSVKDLKTPWQIRAENEEMRRSAEAIARRGKPIKVGVSRYQTDNRRTSDKPITSASPSRRSQMDAWVSVFALTGKEPHGIQTYKDPKGRFDVVYTSPSVIDFSSAQGKEKLECRALYVTLKHPNGRHESLYLIALRAITDDYRFSKIRTRLSARIDNQTLSLGGPFGFRGQGLIGSGGIGSVELMYFRTSRAVLKKIGSAKTVEFSINNLSAALSDDARDLLWQLAVATD